MFNILQLCFHPKTIAIKNSAIWESQLLSALMIVGPWLSEPGNGNESIQIEKCLQLKPYICLYIIVEQNIH